MSGYEDGGSSIEAYKIWQDELRDHGETKHAHALLMRLTSLMGRLDTWTVGFTAEIEHMHTVAYDDPATRPQQLIIGTMVNSPYEG